MAKQRRFDRERARFPLVETLQLIIDNRTTIIFSIVKSTFFLIHWKKTKFQIAVQSNSVITNSTGPWKCVRYKRDVVITVNVFIVKPKAWDQKVERNLFVITVIVIYEFDYI